VWKIAQRYNATFTKYKNHPHWIIDEPGWENIAQGIHE
jgi:hypothetical protein